MEYQDNIFGVNKAKKAAVIQSVVFSFALGVCGVVANAEGHIESPGNYEPPKTIPNIDSGGIGDKSYAVIGTLGLGYAANQQGGGIHINIPPEELCKNIVVCIMYLVSLSQ